MSLGNTWRKVYSLNDQSSLVHCFFVKFLLPMKNILGRPSFEFNSNISRVIGENLLFPLLRFKIIRMIGAMPAVAVRHERRKGQEKRSKRPSQLYIGGHWLPPNSPSPTPSTNGPYDESDRLPEFYICGKVSTLQLVVGSLLLGAIVLVVGLVQLVPNAADADHRYIFIGAGSLLLVLGLALTGVRCCCLQCRHPREVIENHQHPPVLETVHSIDVLVQRRDTQVTSPSELDALIGRQQSIDKENNSSGT
ncbi:uncharacterized protein LOC123317439 isoform X2 [Coccinella septempunctata]|uniref:uncharacterized protein LOC123317439 isoform X2 n=1 Tax=Coccinella septempunctata TaxID=41139 RepID=UPI001D07A5E5|nr:uncharacterized protein LOC123317439 isoform X2 [Coccinella septempunctata]